MFTKKWYPFQEFKAIKQQYGDVFTAQMDLWRKTPEDKNTYEQQRNTAKQFKDNSSTPSKKRKGELSGLSKNKGKKFREAELEVLKGKKFTQTLFTAKAIFTPPSSSTNKSTTGNDEEEYANFTSVIKSITKLKQDKEEK